MADVPDRLVLKRHRDLDGIYRRGIWVRRVVISLICVSSLLGLANVFGQDTSTVRANVARASISVSAPTAVRGGDLFGAEFHITAKQTITKTVLKLDPGWGEGLSVNTIEPSPVAETSDNGRLSFNLGQIRGGRSYTLFMQFQVDPTYVTWQQAQNVALDDGRTRLATIQRTITVYP